MGFWDKMIEAGSTYRLYRPTGIFERFCDLFLVRITGFSWYLNRFGLGGCLELSERDKARANINPTEYGMGRDVTQRSN